MKHKPLSNLKNKKHIKLNKNGQVQWNPPIERIKKMLLKYNFSEIAREEGVCRSAVCTFVKENSLEEYREQVGHHLKKKNAAWKGYEKITGTYWGRIIRQAKDRKVKFDITIEEAWKIYLEQDGKCVLSGLPIRFGVQKGQMNEETKSYHKGTQILLKEGSAYSGKYFERQTQTASLDRIDSNTRVYNADNCQWVHANVNLLKNKMSDEKVIEWATKIYSYNLSKGKYNK